MEIAEFHHDLLDKVENRDNDPDPDGTEKKLQEKREEIVARH